MPASSGADPLAIPIAMSNSTVRLALTVGASRALAIGMVPIAVRNLATGVVKSMFVHRVLTTGVLVAAGLIATGAAVFAYQTARPVPPATAPGAVSNPNNTAVVGDHDGLLSTTGIVRMPDGSPAVGASVRAFTGLEEPVRTTLTDDTGRFQLRGVFGNGGRLHASTPDGRAQALVTVPALATRTVFGSPLEVKLSPAFDHRVTVVSLGHPVAEARVSAGGTGFRVEGVTGPDGKALLRLPADAPITELTAWHQALGVNGKSHDERRARETTELSLLPPAPHTIRVVDTDGQGIAGVELGISVRTEDSDWIIAKHIDAARLRTDATGAAIVPWVPREKLRYVDVDLVPVDTEWKVDRTDRTGIGAGITTGTTTVHVRREHTVQGRLIMPEGADAEGILITGFGFGPANNGDTPYARARRDGTFTFRVPSEHAYVLGITDLKWASDPWSGIILATDQATPAEIAMQVYPATPLVVRVTRGPKHDPVVNAWVHLASLGHVAWTDKTGKKQTATSGARSWLTTGADGVARAAVGKGEHRLRLTSGDWNEERTVKVTGQSEVEVEFHRAWTGEQRITGRLMVDGKPFAPSASLAARAWTPQVPLMPLAFEPVVHPDGTFDVAFDAETVTLLFIDRERQRSGLAERVRGGVPIEVAMEAMSATYGGTLLDEQGQPLAGRILEMSVKTSDGKAIATQQTDCARPFSIRWRALQGRPSVQYPRRERCPGVCPL